MASKPDQDVCRRLSPIAGDHLAVFLLDRLYGGAFPYVGMLVSRFLGFSCPYHQVGKINVRG